MIGLNDQANRVLNEIPQYLPKELRVMLVNGAPLEFPSDFTLKDVDSFVARREKRRHGMHVYEGNLLTDLLEQYITRKQLLNMNLV